MPLTVPNLDDRNFEQLVAETRARIPVHTPEWTNLNDSDPGITLVQLFVRSGLASSGKEARRLIAEGGARLDDVALTDAGALLDAAALAGPRKLSAGRKRHALVKLEA